MNTALFFLSADFFDERNRDTMIIYKRDLHRELDNLRFAKNYIEAVKEEIGSKGRYEDKYISIKVQDEFIIYSLKGEEKRHVI